MSRPEPGLPNGLRGEVAFEAGGRRFVLRPSFEALIEIETRLETGLVELAERMTERRYGARELLVLIHAGARAADPSVREAEIGEAIAQAGLREASLAALAFLSRALGGEGRDSEAPRAPPERGAYPEAPEKKDRGASASGGRSTGAGSWNSPAAP